MALPGFISAAQLCIINKPVYSQDLRSGPRGWCPLTRQTCPVPPGWWRSEAALQEAEHLLGRPHWTCWHVERIFAASPYSCQPPPCLKSHTDKSGHYNLTMEDDKSDSPLLFSQLAVQSIQISCYFFNLIFGASSLYWPCPDPLLSTSPTHKHPWSNSSPSPSTADHQSRALNRDMLPCWLARRGKKKCLLTEMNKKSKE